MMPGRMNPKQMQRMMKKMGMSMNEVENVDKVVIHAKDKEIHINSPSVTIMDVQGEKTFQVQGDIEEVSKGSKIPESDVELVMSQTGVSRDDALRALEEADGEPAEAIIKLMG